MSDESKYTSKTPDMLNIKKGTIILPEGGLKPNTTYIVEAAFSKHSVINRTLFYTGFLNGKNNTPGSYSWFLRTENCLRYHHAYFLEFIAAIDMHPDAMENVP